MNFQLFLTRFDELTQVARSTRLLRALLCYPVLAGLEHRRIFSERFQTVVDIGANRGQFALAVRQWVPRARIICFEPLSRAAGVFRKVFQGDSKVRLHQAAVGPEPGEATIQWQVRTIPPRFFLSRPCRSGYFGESGKFGRRRCESDVLRNLSPQKKLLLQRFSRWTFKTMNWRRFGGAKNSWGTFLTHT